MSGSESTPLQLSHRVAKLRELHLLEGEENARFMPGTQFQQLVDNLKRDGALTSVPLVYQGTVYSGNHRVAAAIDAGIEEALILEIVSECTPERLRALQLAHNAIEGQDDPNILQKLYDSLSFAWKRYSGLTDNAFGKVSELDIKALSVGAPQYQELVVLFLPEEQNRFLIALKEVDKKLKKNIPVLAGRFEDFDRFFDAIVTLKKVKGIHNTAIALRTIAELALETLTKQEVQAPNASDVPVQDSAG